ncbi:MAG: MBL fold metallo-hydrolase, partial [Halobacteria archaeon]|nr:MBL fold metallo-hydrolase [Halobacteria archaeon]
TTRERAREVGLEGSFLEDAVERWRDAIERNRGCLPPDEIDVFLSGGDRVDVGGRSFEAVHTPGHQKHHLCFETSIEGENVLFSGDALTGKFRSVIYHVGFAEEMYDAVGAYYAAFERLERLSVDRVYPGHGPVFTDYDDAVERSVKSLDRLIDRVEEALNEFDEASALDVALSRADDPATVEHTIFDTVGGLGYLEKQGKVDSYVEGGVRYFEAVDEE